MNWTKGLFRIWILLAVVCWGGGGYLAYEGYVDSQRAGIEVRKNYSQSADSTDELDIKRYLALSRGWGGLRDSYDMRRDQGFVIMSIPVGLFILYWIIAWVFRGFRPK